MRENVFFADNIIFKWQMFHFANMVFYASECLQQPAGSFSAMAYTLLSEQVAVASIAY
jgi:hypothetical protein